MKKLFLLTSVLSVVAFTSCKSEKEKVDTEIEKTKNNVDETVSEQLTQGEEIKNKVAEAVENLPAFTDPKVTEFVNKYSKWATDIKSAASTEDLNKLADLTQESVEFKKELEAIKQTLSKEDAKKIQDWTDEIQKELSK